jgi:sugar lactone lactonase YvrE
VPGRPTYVYYLPSGARQPILLDGNIARPNGLTLAGDGKALIVDDTLNPTVFAYDVQSDGSVKNKRHSRSFAMFPRARKAVQTVCPSTAMTVSTSRRRLFG